MDKTVVDIASPAQYIKVNELQEVTSNNIFSNNSSIPDANGLASYDIFGEPMSESRKKRFAYISLGDTFIHPMAYDTLCYLKKIVKDVVFGNGDFYMMNGNITKVSAKKIPGPKDDVGTGVKWLKKHFNEIIFEKPDMSETVKDRISFIKSLKPEEMFITEWMVMPAFFRDVDITSDKKNEINIMYQFLIAQTGIIKSTASMFKGYVVTDSHKKVQDKLIEMYMYFTSFVGGTKAFMQLHVLGKAVDYAARMVISTPDINCERPSDMEVDFSHSAVPLSMAMECFAPFIHYGFKQFVNNKIGASEYMYAKDKKGNLITVRLAQHWEECLLKDNIQKLIKLYTDSKEHRLDYFTLEGEDGSRIPLGYMTTDGAYVEDNGTMVNLDVRPITLCEMFYMIAYQTIKDKPNLTTRYPVEDYHNIYPSLMNIVPFYKTEKRTIEGIEYPRFPIISKEDLNDIENIPSKFTDTLRLFPTNLEALGADFDGDQTSNEGVFTKNSGSEEYIYSLTNIINIGGGTMRNTKDVTAHTIYALTRSMDD